MAYPLSTPQLMEATQMVVPNTRKLEEEHLHSEFTTGDGKQRRDWPAALPLTLVRHHKSRLLLEKDLTSGALSTSRPPWGSVLCRKCFCRWEAAVGCVGVGHCSLRCFLMPSAHDSLSSSAQLFSNHESARQTPFG